MRILQFFQMDFKQFIHFFAKIWAKPLKYSFVWVRGWGGGSLEASDFIKNLEEKWMQTFKLLKIFMDYERDFYLASQLE